MEFPIFFFKYLKLIYFPERFLKENLEQIQPFTYRPFGAGNRTCIGSRFARSEIKICMAKLLNRFKLESGSETGLKFNKGSLAFINYDQVKINFSTR